MNAKICRVINESAKSGFGCFLEAASRTTGVGQISKAPADHLSIADPCGNFERFSQMTNCRVPLFETSLGRRKTR
jgi:hypothetical protein